MGATEPYGCSPLSGRRGQGGAGGKPCSGSHVSPLPRVRRKEKIRRRREEMRWDLSVLYPAYLVVGVLS
jgi:hypothetical protein